MKTTQPFTIGAIASAYEGHLVTNFADVQELIEYMAGEPVWTHQIPRAMDSLKRPMLEQLPWLDDIPAPPATVNSEETAAEWRTILADRFGETHELSPASPNDYTSINPIHEIAMNHPDTPIIPAIIKD